jgi:hypothetical protein
MFFMVKILFVFVSLPLFITQMQWLVLGFCIPLSTCILNLIKGVYR